MIPSSIIEILNAGGVVAYPTSTQPGLASLPTQQGLDALFALKQITGHQTLQKQYGRVNLLNSQN